MKNIIVACGTGIATSTYVVGKLKDLINRSNLNLSIKQGTYTEVEGLVDSDTQLIISSSNIAKEIKGVPVMVAIPYISGVGIEKFEEKILNIINLED